MNRTKDGITYEIERGNKRKNIARWRENRLRRLKGEVNKPSSADPDVIARQQARFEQLQRAVDKNDARTVK